MRGWGMRTRLTVAVTAIFATASIVAGVVALRITEDRLLADTRANAEQMLSDYVGRLYGGTRRGTDRRRAPRARRSSSWTPPAPS